MTAPHTKALDALAEQRAWKRGFLVWLMHATQRIAFAAFQKCQRPVFVVLCSRRWGKTIFACLLVWSKALSTPNAIIRYACPTKAHGRKFVQPAMRWLAKMAPAHLRPKFVTQDNMWAWANGSVCHLGSCESDADVDGQVGTECHLAVIDESGKIKSHLLRKLIRTVLLPQFLTTDAKLCVTGTPPDSPEHYFHDLVTQAAEHKTLVTYTIDDCKHVSPEALAKLIDELGGIDSTEAQRELYVRFITETTRAVLPEYAREKDHIVAETTVAPAGFSDRYVSADFGFTDLTVVLFGYVDFERAKLVIQRELVMRRAASFEVGEAVKRVERELWGGSTPMLRVADATTQIVADIGMTTGVHFAPVYKYDATAAVNYLRRWIAQHRIEVDPSCTTLRAHLEFAIWKDAHKKDDYERTETHHWDALDALKYMVRHVDLSRMPIKPLPARSDNAIIFPRAQSHEESFAEAWFSR